MHLQAALFDLDGVIIDSEKLYTVFWDDINKIYPVDIPDFAIAIKGTTLPEILGLYPTQQIRDDITRRLHDFQDNMDFSLIDGAMDFLQRLKDDGVPAALVTSSDPRKMDCLFAKLPQLRGMFSTIIDASKVTKSKPDPQGYLLAAAELKADSAECVVFEDSINGLKAGRASGAKVVALATTHPASKLAPLADQVISSWSALDLSRL